MYNLQDPIEPDFMKRGHGTLATKSSQTASIAKVLPLGHIFLSSLDILVLKCMRRMGPPDNNFIDNY